MNSRTVLKLLRADGWYAVTQKGSHLQLKHPTKPGRVTMINPAKNFKPGTLRSIEKQSGVRLRGR